MSKTTTKLAVLFVCALGVVRAAAADTDAAIDSDPKPGMTERVSVGLRGEELTTYSYEPVINADGRLTGYFTRDGFDTPSFRLYDRTSGVTKALGASLSDVGNFSADGRFLVATTIYPNFKLRIVRFDLQTGTTRHVSVNSNGQLANDWSLSPSVSANGRFVAFASDATNLAPGGTNGSRHIFVRDNAAGTTERVSVRSNGALANDWSEDPWISADGMAVAFSSEASNLVPGDTNGITDVFVHDRKSGGTHRVSVSSTGAQLEALTYLARQSIDAEGRRIVFDALSRNIAPGDVYDPFDVFVHDRKTGETRMVSVDSNGMPDDPRSYYINEPRISANGRYVAFLSHSWLVPGDQNYGPHLYLHDLLTGRTTRENVASNGRADNGGAFSVALDVDGRHLAFESQGDNLVPSDDNGYPDIFVRTRNLLTYTDVAAVTDIDGNTAPELATLRVLSDGNVEVTIKDSATAALVNTVTFPNPDRMIRGIASLPDIAGDGSPEIAVLFRRYDGQGVVQLRDAVSGNELPELHFFGADWEARAITSFDANADGGPDIAVLALKDDTTAALVQVRDAANQVLLGTVRFPADPGDAYVDVTSLPDMNGNGAPEIAALRARPGGHQEAIIKDSRSGDGIKTVKFNVGGMQPGGLAALRLGSAPAIAVLYRKANGQGKVRIRNARTGDTIRTLEFVGHDWMAEAITTLDSNGDAVTDVGVLAVNDYGSAVSVQIRDSLSEAPVSWVGFPTDDR